MFNYSVIPLFSPVSKEKQWKLACHYEPEDKLSPFQLLKFILKSILEKKGYIFQEIMLNDDLLLDKQEFLILQFLSNLFIDMQKIHKKIRCRYGSIEQCNYGTELSFLQDNLTVSVFFDLLFQNDLVIQPPDTNIKCSRCIAESLKMYHVFKKKIQKSSLIKFLAEKYGVRTVSLPNLLKYFSSLKETKEDLIIEQRSCLISEYSFYEKCYSAKIYAIESQSEKIYQYRLNLPGGFVKKEDMLKTFFKNKIKGLNNEFLGDLGKKIKHFEEQNQTLIGNFFPEIQAEIRRRLALTFTLQGLKISKIFPLLVDPSIEEIFLDSKEECLYLNHQTFGRCRTEIHLQLQEIEALKTHLRLESKRRFDQLQSSLIHVINNEFFHCRFSFDQSPSHWKNFALDIRKMNKEIFTLVDLIKFKTLSVKMAVFLVFCILNQINLTIAGEINSGKTTLLNALDLFIPNEYRKIYVEETIETLDMPGNRSHQLKFIVEPDANGENKSKEKEIYKLLHRSGDFIILGEILNRNETQALFQCLSAGLRGLQTTHALNMSGLINRWVIHYRIDKNCLNDLGIILIMKKIKKRRIILSINEVNYISQNNQTKIKPVFSYDPINRAWNQNISVIDLKIFKEINTYIHLPDSKYEEISSIIEKIILNELKKETPQVFSPFEDYFTELQKIEIMLGDVS
ncbi:MAG: ATPase, T2SS/T4P/T4SS family [Promethearchaeota archaeon]